MAFSTVERGCPNTMSYQMYFRKGDKYISPFHDIPMFADEANNIYNMVVEVPRWTNAKMEMNTKEPLNPHQAGHKEREATLCPQLLSSSRLHLELWCHPTDDKTNCKGDNDPIDICEIGYRVAKRGEVIQVKILGVVALVDEGETDWKLLAIDVNDPLAKDLNDVGDIEKHMPGLLKASSLHQS
ncbi:hypothetical protein MRX96_012411 [Rhipicephalus microplus]